MQDVLDSSYLVLNQCTYIVLDEADRMLDMGFEPQITAILENMGGDLKDEDETTAYAQEEKDLAGAMEAGKVPKHRLTAMFSATMPPEVERLAKTFLRHPAIISVGDQDSGKNKRIEQRVLWMSDGHKDRQLASLLSQHDKPNDKIIVFVNEKKTADKVGKTVERGGKSCVVLHGGKQQDQREASLAQFKGGGCVLVATDVAGRGIDVPGGEGGLGRGGGGRGEGTELPLRANAMQGLLSLCVYTYLLPFSLGVPALHHVTSFSVFSIFSA